MKKSHKKRDTKQRFSLTLSLAFLVFVVLLIAIGLAVLAVYIFTWTGVISGIDEEFSIGSIIAVMVGISIVMGSILALLLAKFPLRPFNHLINRMNRLASGDFKTRLEYGAPLKSVEAFNEISNSFNSLAEELESTEMLRSDFINNFSHEFKTPIVSIAGLAKLVNKGNLTEQERARYLTAIEEESLRLATMATKVLNLTKIENQAILTDLSRFNLSEQIRASVLLLESNWTNKCINLCLDFDEYKIEANEELLKQVWINLIENAIKFSSHGGRVTVEIIELNDGLAVSVSNTGSEIAPENTKKIFNKFYQADESHASEGNGIGLAIVKRIVDLHKGDIYVKSDQRVVTFTVTLPKKQTNK